MSLIKTPFGTYDTTIVADPGPTSQQWGDWFPRNFFFHADPYTLEDWPLAMQVFEEIYGPQYTSILKKFRRFPEHIDPALVATADDLAYFLPDGRRAWYTVEELLQMDAATLMQNAGIRDWRTFLATHVWHSGHREIPLNLEEKIPTQ